MGASLGACTATLGPDEEDAGTGGNDAVGAGGDAATGGAATGGDTGSGGAATGGDTGNGGVPDPAPTFANFKTIVEYYDCASSDCHGDNGHNPLNLVMDDGLYGRLMDPAHLSSMCENLPMITPGNPAQSALFVIMTDGCWTTELKDGMEVPLLLRMPAGCTINEFGSSCVEQPYLDGVRDWILAGAPQD